MKSIKSIYYHNPTPQQFEKTVAWLQKKRYRFISIEELYCYVTKRRPICEKLVFLSLDDAWHSNLKLISTIEKHNVPITIFAPVEPIISGNYWWEFVPKEERENFKLLSYDDFCQRLSALKEKYKLERSCMTAEELRDLARHPLVSIQAHTLTHPILTCLTDADLARELKEGKEQLERIIKQEVDYFSYPNGTYAKREVDMAKDIYKMAFTTDLRYITPKEKAWTLPRIEVTGRCFRDKLKFYNIWPVMRKIGCWILRKK